MMNPSILYLLIGIFIGWLIGFFMNGTSSGQAPHGGLQQVKDDFFQSIDSKFDMITAYTQFRHPEYKAGDWGIANKNEGNPFYYGVSKTKFIFDHLRRHVGMHGIQTICEVGFNAGHSAALFLDTIPHAQMIEFDLGDIAWSTENAKLLSAVYGKRFTYIQGDSRVTIPEFESNSTKCDVLFVDGVKGEAGRMNDVLNMIKISRPGALVFGDEANTKECMSGEVDRAHKLCTIGPHGDTQLAWNTLVRDGTLKYIDCSTPVNIEDITCLWHL